MTAKFYRVPVAFHHRGFVEIIAEDDDAARMQATVLAMSGEADIDYYDSSIEVGTPQEEEEDESDA
jgi:hypothetical protein